METNGTTTCVAYWEDTLQYNQTIKILMFNERGLMDKSDFYSNSGTALDDFFHSISNCILVNSSMKNKWKATTIPLFFGNLLLEWLRYNGTATMKTPIDGKKRVFVITSRQVYSTKIQMNPSKPIHVLCNMQHRLPPAPMMQSHQSYCCILLIDL